MRLQHARRAKRVGRSVRDQDRRHLRLAIPIGVRGARTQQRGVLGPQQRRAGRRIRRQRRRGLRVSGRRVGHRQRRARRLREPVAAHERLGKRRVDRLDRATEREPGGPRRAGDRDRVGRRLGGKHGGLDQSPRLVDVERIGLHRLRAAVRRGCHFLEAAERVAAFVVGAKARVLVRIGRRRRRARDAVDRLHALHDPLRARARLGATVGPHGGGVLGHRRLVVHVRVRDVGSPAAAVVDLREQPLRRGRGRLHNPMRARGVVVVDVLGDPISIEVDEIGPELPRILLEARRRSIERSEGPPRQAVVRQAGAVRIGGARCRELATVVPVDERRSGPCVDRVDAPVTIHVELPELRDASAGLRKPRRRS